MRRTRPVIAVTALVLALGSAAPAFATDPEPTEPVQTAPPAEPEESDLVDTEPEPEPVDDLPSVKSKDYHKGVGVPQSHYNGTSRTARSTFTSQVAGTVGVSFSGKLGVKVSVAIVDIESEFNVKYGVYRLKSYGYSQYKYANCTNGTKNNVTIYTPRRVGWYIWES